MSSEETPLIQNNDKNIKAKRPSLRHALIFPMLIMFYLPAETLSTITNEWMQHTITNEQFQTQSLLNNTQLKSATAACEDKNKTDSTSKEYKHAEKILSQWYLYNKLAAYIPLIISNVILQGYSDMYGRKFLFILAIVGVFVKNACVTATIYFNSHFIFLTIAGGLESLTGAGAAIISMSYAYTADITHNKPDRILGIVAIEAVVQLAGLCPAVIAGHMVQSGLGYTYSAIICASAGLISVVIVIFLLPETLPPERRVSKQSIFSNVKRTVDFYASSDFKGQRLLYILLLGAFTVSYLAGSNRGGMETLYFLNQPFCWDPINYGYFTLVRQCLRIAFGTATMRPLQKCLSNEFILIIASFSSLASFVIEGLATAVLTVYASSAADFLSFLNGPIIRGLMSSMTKPDQQGSLFAVLTVISELSALAAGFSTTYVYQATLSIANGFVFLVMATLEGLKIILLFVFWCKKTGDRVSREES